MNVESEKDFTKLRQHINAWHRKFPMFRHDVFKIENMIEEHIKQYSIAMVHYRQSHKNNFLEKAEHHIQEINRIIDFAEKMELMSMLSGG